MDMVTRMALLYSGEIKSNKEESAVKQMNHTGRILASDSQQAYSIESAKTSNAHSYAIGLLAGKGYTETIGVLEKNTQKFALKAKACIFRIILILTPKRGRYRRPSRCWKRPAR